LAATWGRGCLAQRWLRYEHGAGPAGAVVPRCGTAWNVGRWRRRSACGDAVSRLATAAERTLTAMQTLNYDFPANRVPSPRIHVGVVASGDLEVLLDQRPNLAAAQVRVRTSVDGFDTVWQATLARFFAHTPLAGRWELNDFGATPAVVTLRLRQAAEAATS